ncbi:Dam family site-specific DNA-(adenine-N6)-methyltransferase [Rhizobium sp. L245/93]|uniref:DNA adenine methylase n=1 Tax=Rhizobium sp. L245/93 TaxID=2819998 RepID=UPI001AD9E3ED|nr:Dam family site-specific DNA-(adenine-N6)-methyltransferase [Rhizobium sp. L245/93]MBO9166787.1 Dam family site-specific DNA-(adenine-N6)-methyltransferase [Rhizobium sp. L245/93]
MQAPEALKTSHGPSFLRWAGSKRKALKQLSAAYTADLLYIEPFAGSAALFFERSPKSALLADLNGHLINTMRYVRDKPSELHAMVSGLSRASDEYYRKREQFNTLKPHGLEAAVLFVYLNRNCFNGLWRTNSSGKFNVPHGGVEMGNTPPLELFLKCSATLQNAKLRHQDFRRTVSQAGAGCFVYADPPYFTAHERTFVEYGKRSFGRKDLQDLIDGLEAAEMRGAEIALTYSDGMPIDVPKHWSQTRFEVTRNVGGFSGSRKKNAEVLYTSVPLRDEA